MTDPDDNPIALVKRDWIQEQARQAEQDRLQFERDKKALFEALKPTGITHISVEFDGNGDSGQIDAMLARSEGETESKPLPAIAIPREVADDSGGEPRQENIALATAVETLCYDLLDQHHGGWENNAGGFGRFTFDVAAGTIHLEMNHRFEDWTTTETSF